MLFVAQGRLNVTPISLSTTGVFHPSSLNFLLAFSRAYGNKTKMHTTDGLSIMDTLCSCLKFFFAKAAIAIGKRIAHAHLTTSLGRVANGGFCAPSRK
ncbi:hypothetical protein ADUPG1_009168 [Aduncisulcus paluster]|uniref:Uncharacterized protein n=1 Tax=Aduncisulcus paluster TaxID=2918883 RepID=A0ABQ5KWW5_9EUKA|nr:hypothetical protein ADUPG1_009168 [Aduncisulcus paluster]